MNTIKSKSRNVLLDFAKGISALGVVLVHFQFPGIPGKILCSVGVTGVVLFFLISGYQSYSPDGSSASKIAGRFKRNLSLTLIALAVYAVFTITEQLLSGTFAQWISEFKSPLTWLRIIVLGDFSLIHGDPLWFMAALLYSYLILLLMERKRLHKIFYTILPILLLLRISMETYTNSFSSIEWPDWHFSGNFLVGGLPVMLLGNFIACHKHRFINIRKDLLFGGAITSLILVFVSVNVKVFSLDLSQPFKILSAFFVFLICLSYPSLHISGLIEKIGREFSLYLYLFHYLIGITMLHLTQALECPLWVNELIIPVAVIAVSLAVSCAITKVSRVLQKKE